MYASSSSFTFSVASATVKPTAPPSSKARLTPELELFHNFIRWHAPDELLQPWGTRTRQPKINLAGRTVRHDMWSDCLVDVKPFSKNAVDVCFIMKRKSPQKRFAVRARVHISQWAADERHAVLTADDVRAAAFRGFQTLAASPQLEPVEYVTSQTSADPSDDEAPPPHPSNAHSLQWSMSM